MISSYVFMEMIVGLFFALSWIQKIWKKSVTTFIVTNMLMMYVVLHNLGEDIYGYAVLTTCLSWLYYRSMFKRSNDKWLYKNITLTFK